MEEIVMGKDKRIGDSVFITEIEEGINVIGKPDVLRNPMTCELERILHVIVTQNVTYCPKCKNANEPGVEITVTEKELCVYPCKKCGKFVFFRVKG